MQYTCKYLSPLGEMLLASDGEALTGAWFEGQKYYAAALAVAHEEKSLPVFEETRTWLDGYFNGRKPGLMPLCGRCCKRFLTEKRSLIATWLWK